MISFKCFKSKQLWE